MLPYTERDAAACLYAADVIAHFQAAHGITFQSLSPFNEPSSPAWCLAANCKQVCIACSKHRESRHLVAESGSLGCALSSESLTVLRLSWVDCHISRVYGLSLMVYCSDDVQEACFLSRRRAQKVRLAGCRLQALGNRWPKVLPQPAACFCGLDGLAGCATQASLYCLALSLGNLTILHL